MGNKVRRGAYAALLLAWFDVHAATVAGTSISNVATVTYSIEGAAAAPIVSAPASFKVDELIALTLTWQDAAPVSVNSPDSNDPLRFELVNAGNGSETFFLSRNNAVGGNQFDPVSTTPPLYFESNDVPGLQIGVGGDAPGNNITLAPEASVTVYVMSDTPADLSTGSQGDVALSAASATPGASGAAFGTILIGAGDSGVDAVVGVPLAQARGSGRYLVSGLSVVVAKSVIHPANPGLELIPGARLTYRVQVTVAGAGTADNLVIADPMPAEISYTPNSTRLGGAARTDAGDADDTEFSANTLTVTLGSVAAPASFIIEFDATLN